MKDKVIGSGKPKRVSKSPWERRVRKKGQGKLVGQGCLKGNKGTKEPTSNVIQSPNDHIESLREE